MAIQTGRRALIRARTRFVNFPSIPRERSGSRAQERPCGGGGAGYA